MRISVPTLGLFLVLGLFYLLSFRSPTDPDYFLHLATGRWILAQGWVPAQDPFSFTADGRTWTDHEWLAQVIIALLDEAGGYAANMALHAALFVATLGVIYRLVRSLGLRYEVGLVLVGWSGLVMLPFVAVRPQLWTWLCAAIVLSLLFGLGRGSRRGLWPAVPLMVPWANLHGGYIIGLGLLGMSLGATLLHRLLPQAGASPPVRHQCLGLGLGLAGAAVSPYGLSTLWYPITYLLPGDPSRAFISEWQSPDFHAVMFLPFATYLIAFAILGVARSSGIWPMGLVAGTALLSLHAARGIPFFAIVAPAVLAQAMLERWPGLAQEASPRPPGTARSLLHGAVLGGAAMLGATALAWTPGLQLGPEPVVTPYPEAGSRYVRDHLPGARIFNTYHWGGFLVERLYPESRVFIDGRADIFGHGRLEEYVRLQQAPQEWRAAFDRYAVDVAILEKESALASLIHQDPEWTEALRGPVEVVLVRRPLLDSHQAPGSTRPAERTSPRRPSPPATS